VVTRVDSQDLIAAACEHYGYGEVEARDYLRFAAGTVTKIWRDLMTTEGIPESEIERYRGAFSFAAKLDAATAK
jgi:hypothetical protein